MTIALSLGLLVLRLVAGLSMSMHGTEKLFGWFGGAGFNKTTQMMQKLQFKPDWFWAGLGGLGEFAGGLSLALGLLTPLGAAAVLASMFMAVVKFTWKRGFSASKMGFEYPLSQLAVSLALGLIGPGSYSLDALFGFPLSVLGWFCLFAAAGIIIDLLGMIISRPAAAPASKETHSVLASQSGLPKQGNPDLPNGQDALAYRWYSSSLGLKGIFDLVSL